MRQVAFVQHYVDDAPIPGYKAAILAGYPETSCNPQASRLLKNVQIIKAIKERRNEHDKKNVADREWKRRKLVQIVEAGLTEKTNMKTGITAPINLNASVGALAELAKIDGEIIKRSEIKAEVKHVRTKDELEAFLVSFGIDPLQITQRDIGRHPITIEHQPETVQ